MDIKMVINRCYGGYSLSEKAIKRLRELGSEAAIKCAIISETNEWGDVVTDGWGGRAFYPKIERHDPLLVQVVEELGKEASGECADLRVVTAHINIGVNDHDGMERVSISGWADF
jgi:hypothetical protein